MYYKNNNFYASKLLIFNKENQKNVKKMNLIEKISYLIKYSLIY